MAAGTLFFVDNAIKSIDGQLAALNDARQFVRKVRAEKALRAKVAASARLKREYGGAWKAIAAAEKRNVAMFLPYSLIVGGRFFDARLFNLAFSIVLGAHERTLPDAQRLSAYRAANLPLLEQQLFSVAPVHPSLNKLELVSTLTMMRDLLGGDAPICATLFAHRSP
ncbi:dipeptidyl-peptidase 7, partial [mine drainage metagenome]